MELTTLRFSVDTTELDTAVTKLDALTQATERFNSENGKTVAASTASASASKQQTKATEELNSSSDKATKLLERLKNTHGDLVAGFTKGESSILNQARAYGMAGDALNPFMDQLKLLKELTKDPFDASIGAIRSVQQEFDKLQQRGTLAAQGISLTTKQLEEYSRLASEVKGKVIQMGIDPASVDGQAKMNTMLATAQKEYLGIAQKVNSLVADEKALNKILQDQEAMFRAISNERMKEYANSIGKTSEGILELREQYSALEAESNRVIAANEKVANSIDHINQVAALMKQGMSKGEATQRVNLLGQGVTAENIDKLVAANKQLETSSDGASKGLDKQAKAAEWATNELARAEHAVESFTETLRVSTSNKLFKFSDMLGKAGFSKEEAERMMKDYAIAMGKGQDKMNAQTSAKMRDLARDVSVQMGDVFVSLAGGMNPFMVMIQQGDQLRGAFDKTKLSAEETKQAMLQASSQIAQGFIATGKAIGTFFIGALQATGGKLLEIVTGPIKAFRESLAYSAKAGLDTGKALQFALGDSAMAFVGAAMSSMTLLIGSAVAALGVLAYTFYKVSAAQDDMNKQLARTGATMGIMGDSAVAFANSFSDQNISFTKAADIIENFAKQTGFTREEMEKIVPVASKMMSTFGMTAEQVATEFGKFKKDPVEALERLAVETGLVDQETIKFVRTQKELGNTSAATAAAVMEASKVMGETAAEMKKNYSGLGILFNGIKESWNGMIAAFQKQVAPKSQLEILDEKIARTKRIIQESKTGFFQNSPETIKNQETSLKLLEQERDVLIQKGDVEAENRAKSAQAAALTAEINKSVIKDLSEVEKIQKEIARIKGLQTQNDNLGDKKNANDALLLSQALVEQQRKLAKAEEEANKPSKERQAAIDLYNSTLKKLINLREEAEGKTIKLTKAEIDYNQAMAQGAAKSLKPKEIADLKTNRDLAINSEKLQEYTKEEEKIKEELVKYDERRKVLVSALTIEYLKQQEVLSKESDSLDLRVALMGKTEEEARNLTLEYQRQADLRAADAEYAIKAQEIWKKFIDIQNKTEGAVFDIDGYEKAIAQAEEIRVQKGIIANRKIAISLQEYMTKGIDSNGSISKSAERFATSLKEAGKTSFGNLISSLGKVVDAMDEMIVKQEVFNKLKKDATGKNLEKLQIENAKNQLKSYGDLTAAAKGFFKEGTTGYKSLQKAEQVFRAFEMALAVKTAAVKIAENAKVIFASVAGEQTKATAAVTGASQEIAAQQGVNATKATAAVINQGGGDPYSAFVRVAAMAAIMAGLGYAVSGGGGSAPTAPTNQGTGTVFGGGKDDKSKSVENSLKILEDVDTWTMRYSAQMLNSLRSIEKQIGGITNLVLQSNISGDTASRLGAENKTTVPFINSAELNLTMIGAMLGGPLGAAIGLVVSKIPIVQKITNALFGTKQTVKGSGLMMEDSSLSSVMMNGANLKEYADVTKKSKFLGITYSTKNSTITGDADAALSNQVKLIFKDFYDTVKLAAIPLGANLDEVANRLDNFVVSIGKIDLQGLTGEQIQEKLVAVFSAAGDKIAQAAIPGLEKFQQVGEGYLETLIRVASSVEAVTSWFDTLGYSLTGLNIDRAMGLVDLFGDLDTLNSSLSDYYSEFYSESEKTAKATQQMTKVLGDLGIAMPTTRLQFRLEIEKALADGNDELAATLLKLSPAIASIIPALQETGRSAEDIASSIADMQTTLKELNIDLLNAQGRTEEAKAAFRALSTEGMTPAEIATWDAIQAMKAQIEATNALAQAEQKRTNEALTLQGRIDQLQGNTAAIRERELAALDPANRQLQLFIYSLEDLAKAEADAKAAADAKAQAEKAIAQENYGLQTELLTLQGNTAELRKRELALLDPSNRALKQEIYDLQDKIAADKAAADAADEKARAEKEAADAATRAAEEQIQAAEQLKQAWQSITDTIYEEVARIRGLAGTDKANLANAQSNFDIATAKARAGDQEAAKMLPELSKTLLDLAGKQAVSLVALRRIQLQTAASLEQTANGFASSYGLTVPAFAAGGSYSGGLALVGEQGPELINFNKSGTVYNANKTSSMMNSNLESLIEKLNDNIEGLRYEVRAGVTHSAKTAKLLNRVIKNADTISVSFDDPQKVTVV